MAVSARVYAKRRNDVLEKPFTHEACLGTAVFSALFPGRHVDAHLTADRVDDGL